MMAEKFSPELAELRLLATLAGVAPSRMAKAFSDPEQLFKHITLDELERFKLACDRVAALMDRMTACTAVAVEALQKKGFVPNARR